jgi:hypothetical protein
MKSPYVYQVYLSLTPPFSTNMTMVSDDPTWWPNINAYRFSSYFVVAAFVVSAYDWGEHDKIKELPMSYKYLQHLHSDKRSNWSGGNVGP